MYKAIFEVPATVRVEVFIDHAVDQTDALAQAFDRVMEATPGSARVLALHTDGAKNTALERVEAATVVTPTVQSVQATQRDGYVLQLYHGALPPPGTPCDRTESFVDFPLSKRALTSHVGDDGAKFASGRIVNQLSGAVMVSLRNPRGDWEVDAYGKDGSLKHAESWLTKQTALATAKLLASRDDMAEVRITDFTNRQNGPRIYRRMTS